MLNIEHRETILYSSLEALAFSWMGLAVYFWWRTLILLSNQKKYIKYLYFVFIATALLVVTKYSYYLFGINYPIFYWLKRAIIIGLIGVTIVLSLLIFFRKTNDSTFPKNIQTLLVFMGVLLPVAGSVDYLLIKDKFYEGPVRLSMNFPLFLTSYLCLTIFLIILIIRGLRSTVDSKVKFSALIERYQVTPRELEIINLVIQGKSNQEIAKMLFISPATVKNHLRHIFEKLKVSSRYELISEVLSVKK